MKNLSSLGYTHNQIINMLKSHRKIDFRFELLDKNERKLGDITADGYIDFNSDAEIMGAGSFTLKEISDINYIDERLKPYLRLYTPRGWIEYPLGVYLISSPTRKSNGIYITRDVEVYDKSVILREDKFDNRYIVYKNTVITAAVIQILNSAGIANVNIENSELVAQTDIEFEIGTTKLYAINYLLKVINSV